MIYKSSTQKWKLILTIRGNPPLGVSLKQHAHRSPKGLRPTVHESHDFLKDNMAQPSTFPRSHLLILGPNSVQSLLPVTPISQAEALLNDHRIEDVIQLVDQQRKKVQSKLVVDASEVRRSSLALSFDV